MAWFYVDDYTNEVIEQLTIKEYLGFITSVYDSGAHTQIQSMMDLFDLTKVQDDLMKTLSHGMRKKTQIVVALSHSPRLLVMDEPTNGLDPSMISLLGDILLELKRSDTSVLIATHNLAFAERVCDCIHIVHASKLVASGSCASLVQTYGSMNLEEVYLAVTKGGQWRGRLAEVFGCL